MLFLTVQYWVVTKEFTDRAPIPNAATSLIQYNLIVVVAGLDLENNQYHGGE